jgi:phage-related protein
MRLTMKAGKPLHFLGSALTDLRDFPVEARKEIGFALHLAQMGDKSVNAVPMVGFGGARVLEMAVAEDGEAYRAAYTVKFAKAVYVLHAYQKKSKKGSETPKPDMNLIKSRLKAAERHYVTNYEQDTNRQVPTRERKHERAS